MTRIASALRRLADWLDSRHHPRCYACGERCKPMLCERCADWEREKRESLSDFGLPYRARVASMLERTLAR